MNEQPGGLLDENDVKVRMGLKNCFDDKVVFSDVLQKKILKFSKIIVQYCSQMNELNFF